MAFLETIDAGPADGEVAVIYGRDVKRVGYLPNYTRTFSLHPGADDAWRHLIAAIAKPMDERRCELATVGAATSPRSSYCSLAHGKILNDKFFEPNEVRQIAEDPSQSVLDETDAGIVDLAAKVAGDATTVTEADIERLRSTGLSDREIFDVILAAAARSFSKVLDATGTLADPAYRELDPDLRDALTTGRPIDQEEMP